MHASSQESSDRFVTNFQGPLSARGIGRREPAPAGTRSQDHPKVRAVGHSRKAGPRFEMGSKCRRTWRRLRFPRQIGLRSDPNSCNIGFGSMSFFLPVLGLCPSAISGQSQTPQNFLRTVASARVCVAL